VLYYNLRDAQLSWYIAETRAYFWTNAALARVTGVPFDFLTKNGQGVRTTSMLLRELRKDGYLIPSFTDEEKRALRHDYEGATVLDPRRGWFTSPMSTLDFR
jgi:DNA polymerase delta subunit 1